MKEVNLKIFRDGNQYCVLLGDDLQDGIAAFGDTILEAIEKFIEVWGNSVERKDLDYHEKWNINNVEKMLREN